MAVETGLHGAPRDAPTPYLTYVERLKIDGPVMLNNVSLVSLLPVVFAGVWRFVALMVFVVSFVIWSYGFWMMVFVAQKVFSRNFFIEACLE